MCLFISICVNLLFENNINAKCVNANVNVNMITSKCDSPSSRAIFPDEVVQSAHFFFSFDVIRTVEKLFCLCYVFLLFYKMDQKKKIYDTINILQCKYCEFIENEQKRQSA